VNKAELALSLVGCPSHLSEAELLLRLYESAGLDMLGRLSGHFAFCLYDSKQVGVGGE
jgi:asparagine synthetase B (glutamine-hydrolysing)